MPAPSEGTSANSDMPRMLQMDMEIRDFCSNWAHCDLVSAYVARMVSHNRLDSILFANLYSSALNELLETVFRVHGGSGKLECSVRRKGNLDRVEIVFPADDEVYRIYRDAVAKASGDDAESLYLHALFTDTEPDASLGLLELGVDYGARLSTERRDDGRMCLIAELSLEDEQE